MLYADEDAVKKQLEGGTIGPKAELAYGFWKDLENFAAQINEDNFGYFLKDDRFVALAKARFNGMEISPEILQLPAAASKEQKKKYVDLMRYFILGGNYCIPKISDKDFLANITDVSPDWLSVKIISPSDSINGLQTYFAANPDVELIVNGKASGLLTSKALLRLRTVYRDKEVYDAAIRGDKAEQIIFPVQYGTDPRLIESFCMWLRGDTLLDLSQEQKELFRQYVVVVDGVAPAPQPPPLHEAVPLSETQRLLLQQKSLESFSEDLQSFADEITVDNFQDFLKDHRLIALVKARCKNLEYIDVGASLWGLRPGYFSNTSKEHKEACVDFIRWAILGGNYKRAKDEKPEGTGGKFLENVVKISKSLSLELLTPKIMTPNESVNQLRTYFESEGDVDDLVELTYHDTTTTDDVPTGYYTSKALLLLRSGFYRGTGGAFTTGADGEKRAKFPVPLGTNQKKLGNLIDHFRYWLQGQTLTDLSPMIGEPLAEYPTIFRVRNGELNTYWSKLVGVCSQRQREAAQPTAISATAVTDTSGALPPPPLPPPPPSQEEQDKRRILGYDVKQDLKKVGFLADIARGKALKLRSTTKDKEEEIPKIPTGATGSQASMLFDAIKSRKAAMTSEEIDAHVAAEKIERNKMEPLKPKEKMQTPIEILEFRAKFARAAVDGAQDKIGQQRTTIKNLEDSIAVLVEGMQPQKGGEKVVDAAATRMQLDTFQKNDHALKQKRIELGEAVKALAKQNYELEKAKKRLEAVEAELTKKRSQQKQQQPEALQETSKSL